jgi:hypothetical protein
MSLKHSFALGLLLCLPLCACHGSSNKSSSAATSVPRFSSTDTLPSDASLQPLSDRYGFVRMETLMRTHPLAGDLANLDRQIASLQSQFGAPRVARDTAYLRAAQKSLQHELEEAAARTQILLREHGVALAAQERTQISALFKKREDIGRSFGTLLSEQRDTYAKELRSDRQQAVQTLAASIDERDARLLQTKADELHQRERDAAMKLAQADSGERTSLEAKAANPRLREADAKAVAASLSALDAKEDAQRKANLAADGQLLARLREQMRSDSQREFSEQVARLQKASAAELRARGAVTAAQTQASVSTLPTPGESPDNGAFAARIKWIHAHFQERLDADTRASIAAFKTTHARVQARFDALVRERREAQRNLMNEIRRLQRQRDALSARMTSQIRNKTVSVAEHASIDVVLTDVLAESHAVDLTDDVAAQFARKRE